MNMDEDEVTREPFEDQNVDEEDAGSVSSWQQPRYDSAILDHSDHNGMNTTDETQVEQQDHLDDDDCSSVCEEDVEYAKSFGIQLKNKKIRASYERLMNSGLIDPECSKKSAIATKSNHQEQPQIKTSTTSDCIYHKGCFYQKGDVVALCDQDDGQIYFAQLTGFFQDQYCEKSASINWLVPTRPTSRKSFDPSAYRIGLEDTQLRKLDCMTFVCRCPHDYYLRKFFQSGSRQAGDEDCIHETNYTKNNRNHSYIWTTMRPCSVPIVERTTNDMSRPN